MKRAIGALNPQLDGFEASCFDGVYVTGDINAEDFARINAARASAGRPRTRTPRARASRCNRARRH